MKIVINKNKKIKVIDEKDYLLSLNKEIDYEVKHQEFINLLAFKEALLEAKNTLDSGLNIEFIYEENEHKNALISKVLNKYLE